MRADIRKDTHFVVGVPDYIQSGIGRGALPAIDPCTCHFKTSWNINRVVFKRTQIDGICILLLRHRRREQIGNGGGGNHCSNQATDRGYGPFYKITPTDLFIAHGNLLVCVLFYLSSHSKMREVASTLIMVRVSLLAPSRMDF